MSPGTQGQGHRWCPHGYHVLKSVPVLQLVPQKTCDSALLTLRQGPYLQTLVPTGHAKEDPNICGPHTTRAHEHPPSHPCCPHVQSRARPSSVRIGDKHRWEKCGGGHGIWNAFPGVWLQNSKVRQARAVQRVHIHPTPTTGAPQEARPRVDVWSPRFSRSVRQAQPPAHDSLSPWCPADMFSKLGAGFSKPGIQGDRIILDSGFNLTNDSSVIHPTFFPALSDLSVPPS